jgi:hypothetical protein
VPFEDWHGQWKVLFDEPLEEFLVGSVLAAVVGDGVFQRAGHLDVLC